MPLIFKPQKDAGWFLIQAKVCLNKLKDIFVTASVNSITEIYLEKEKN